MGDMGYFDPTPLISPAGRLGSCLDEDRPLESLCPDQAWPTETSRPRMTWSNKVFFELPRETSRNVQGRAASRVPTWSGPVCVLPHDYEGVKKGDGFCQCQERRRRV